ncbi:hypothetical protein ACPPVV_16370 [Rhodanobacter sp. Col0626]|uniref:hypothetical protein n=1 Tax=Rhodanobacter sp. Col0626 TaxID=3415679 RepID=UPI003CF952D1
MSIELYIERLVIDESLLRGERADRVRAAIERELTQRLARPGAIDVLRGVGAVESLPAALLSSGGSLGERIAATVQDSLGVSRATQMPRSTSAGISVNKEAATKARVQP